MQRDCCCLEMGKTYPQFALGLPSILIVNSGAGGFFRRGISGGERKRVSVGHEMIINPSVLLLDEPTSGVMPPPPPPPPSVQQHVMVPTVCHCQHCFLMTSWVLLVQPRVLSRLQQATCQMIEHKDLSNVSHET